MLDEGQFRPFQFYYLPSVHARVSTTQFPSLLSGFLLQILISKRRPEADT